MKNFLNLNLKCSVWLLLMLFGVTTAAQAQGTRASDSLELVALYNATGGANWINKTNWLSRNPMNTWYGVRLNSSGRVDSLNLSFNRLIGTIPNFNLPNLTYLNLYDNQLSGSVPNFNLPNLTKLNLSNNQLIGIPNFNLPNLQQLSLSSNQLSGSILNNFNLPNLTYLNLSSNQLVGTIPNFNLPNLTSLYLYNNLLRGTIPNFNLPNLQQLSLSSNQLSGSIPNFNFPNLTYLDLSSNQLSGSIPNFNLPNLQQLSLSSNQLSGSIPNFNLPNLTSLYLSSNQLSGCIPSGITTNCPRIGSLSGDIRNNPNLSTQNWGSYWNSNVGACVNCYTTPTPQYRTIRQGDSVVVNNHVYRASGTYQDTIIRSGLCDSIVVTNLTVLSTVTVPPITALQCGNRNYRLPSGRIVSAIGTYQDTVRPIALLSDTAYTFRLIADTTGRCSDSTELVTFYNATGGANWTNRTNWLTNNPMYTWVGVTLTNGRVTSLYLPANRLNGNIPNVNLSNLRELTLYSNQLSGSIPNFNLPNLTLLWLQDNQLSDSIPRFNLPNLQRLDLSRNQLSGSIPNFNSPNLRELKLISMQLSGDIPNFNLPNLQELWLQGNRLNGTIPNFNLPNLIYLELGNNQLSGGISNFNLPNLRQLGLQQNQLSGSIPNFSLPNLTSLFLNNNQLSGSIPNFNLPNLTSLSLYNNQLSGSIPNFNLPNLRELGLNNNQLSGNVPNFNLPNLEKLRLNTNQLSGSISNFNFPNLQQLILDSNLFSGSIPNFTTALTYMAVQSNQFNFGSIENRTWLTQTMQTKTYSPQAKIRLSYQNSKLAMSVGGTVTQETFKWYRNDTLVTTMVGDSTFTPTLNGSYRCEATHSGIPNLTLISLDTLLTVVNCNLSASIIRNGNTLTATATGGRGTYRFLWNNQATTQAINNINSGSNYQVTVTDSLGCVSTAAISIPQVEPYKITPQSVYCNSQQSWLVINMNDYRSCIDAMQIKVTFDTSKIILGANNSIIRGSALPNSAVLSFPTAPANELNINIDLGSGCITGDRDTNLLKIPFRAKPNSALPNTNIPFTVSIIEERSSSSNNVHTICRDTFKVTPNIMGVVNVVKPNGVPVTGKERPLSIYLGDTCTNRTRKIDWDTLRQAAIVPLDSFRYFHLVRAPLPRIPQIGNLPYIIGTDDAAMLRAYLTDNTRNPLTPRQSLAANVVTNDGLSPLDVTTIRKRATGEHSRFDTLFRNRAVNLKSDYIFTRLNTWQIDTCHVLPTQSISCDTPSLTLVMVTLGDINGNGDTITHLIGNQTSGQAKNNSTKLIFDMCRGTQDNDGYKVPVFANVVSTSLDLQLLNLPNSIGLSFAGSSSFSTISNQIGNNYYVSGLIEDTTKVAAWQPLFYVKFVGQQNVHKSMLETINVFHNGQLADYEVYEKSVHCVSTQELAENPFEVYPNPTTGSVQMTTQQPLSENTTLRIYDMLGRNVKNVVLQQGSSNFTIDISNLANGVYQFHFANQYKKVIKH